jgi:hypothetical protein
MRNMKRGAKISWQTITLIVVALVLIVIWTSSSFNTDLSTEDVTLSPGGGLPKGVKVTFSSVVQSVTGTAQCTQWCQDVKAKLPGKAGLFPGSCSDSGVRATAEQTLLNHIKGTSLYESLCDTSANTAQGQANRAEMQCPCPHVQKPSGTPASTSCANVGFTEEFASVSCEQYFDRHGRPEAFELDFVVECGVNCMLSDNSVNVAQTGGT